MPRRNKTPRPRPSLRQLTVMMVLLIGPLSVGIFSSDPVVRWVGVAGTVTVVLAAWALWWD